MYNYIIFRSVLLNSTYFLDMWKNLGHFDHRALSHILVAPGVGFVSSVFPRDLPPGDLKTK